MFRQYSPVPSYTTENFQHHVQPQNSSLFPVIGLE